MYTFNITFECDGESYSSYVQKLYKTHNLPAEYHVFDLDPKMKLPDIWAIIDTEGTGYPWQQIRKNKAALNIMNAIVDYCDQNNLNM